MFGPRPTLLWISQGLAMADRSQAVIIMALETQDRHSLIDTSSVCTESLQSVQQSDSLQPFMLLLLQTDGSCFKNIDKSLLYVKVLHPFSKAVACQTCAALTLYDRHSVNHKRLRGSKRRYKI